MSSTTGRVTIADIAARAGVSIGAVSFALNGRKGVSAETRERILAVADELGWAPASAARSLAGAKTATFGLVLARDPRNLGVETFYMQFLAGIESELSLRNHGLLLQVVPDIHSELETLRGWHKARRVDGVIVTDIRVDDPRIAYLAQTPDLPAVVVGDPSVAVDLMTVGTDDATAVRAAVRHLVDLGHRRITRVAGMAELMHTRLRDVAFHDEARRQGVEGHVLYTDFTPAQGVEATRSALSGPDSPTAIIYDNDVMAVAALGVAAQLGIRVPEDLSIVAWDDSVLCQHSYPRLTSLSHDVVNFGAHVARRLFDVVGGATPETDLDSTPVLRLRESTGPARR
ncbi:LacI family DNA-binding transcriptional regulator [Microbacterium sp. NPDC056234]|uniref:LacI family DNA-binding transcriptional regulator n=1 Tax=Microbacterium sp. NPDC056234 TaxID=3345757 RepID=UPI0035E26499